MKSEDVTGIIALVLLCAAVGLFVGLRVSTWNNQTLKREAIEHGFAQYDPQTGEWRWKDTPDVEVVK